MEKCHCGEERDDLVPCAGCEELKKKIAAVRYLAIRHGMMFTKGDKQSGLDQILRVVLTPAEYENLPNIYYPAEKMYDDNEKWWAGSKRVVRPTLDGFSKKEWWKEMEGEY